VVASRLSTFAARAAVQSTFESAVAAAARELVATSVLAKIAASPVLLASISVRIAATVGGTV
jgi:hypothetical protein